MAIQDVPITSEGVYAHLRLLESVLHNASDTILVTEAEPIDAPGPRIVYVNESFTRMTGYTAAEAIGQTPRMLQSPHTDRARLDEIRAALERWEPIQVEVLNRTKNGRDFWVELHIVPIADENGWWTHWVSIQRETTVRKHVEEEIRRSEEHFRNSLARNATDFAAVLDTDGVIRYQSFSSSGVLGFAPGTWVGSDILTHVHPEDRGKMHEAFQKASEFPGVTPPPVEFRSQHAGGQWCYLAGVFNNHTTNPSVKGIVFNAWDITGKKLLDEALHLRGRAIASSRNGIIIADATAFDTPIVYVNPAFERMTGYSAAEVIGRNCRFLQGTDRQQSERDTLRHAIQEGCEASGTMRNYRKDGTLFYNEISISPVLDENGVLRSFIGIENDVTERRLLEDQLTHQAFHDSLTGLPNRALFLDQLGQALVRATQGEYTLAVLFLDLDRFKVINDSLGHASGDDLLIAVGQRLQTVLRSCDVISRLGGDEFMLLLDGPITLPEASHIAERLITLLKAPFTVQGHEIFTSTSIGIAFSRHDEGETVNLLRDAGIAMYGAKNRGGTRYEVFNQSMNARATRRLEMETHLRQAIERDEFQLHYQPLVGLATGEITGMEVLVRWLHPEHGLILPGEFIPLAEETGLILPIGHWVLEGACRQARQWQEQFPRLAPRTMSVNLSGRQFQQPDLISKIREVLEQTAVDPASIVLEITESVMIEDAESTMMTLRNLKGLGVQLAIDDFGTGYSSLSYLKRFPVDILKIDRSFIAGLGQDESDTALVRGILGLGQALALVSVAEGIETPLQVTALRAMGCATGQGFYFAKPTPPQDVQDLMRNGIKVPHAIL